MPLDKDRSYKIKDNILTDYEGNEDIILVYTIIDVL